jgi:hypothetical protein
MPDPIRLYLDDGNCLVRDNLVLTFFGASPFAEMVAGVAYCVERYLALVPRTALTWHITGATSGTFKPLTPKSFATGMALLTVETAQKKDIHVSFGGPTEWGPDYQLTVDGRKALVPKGFLNPTNVIEMRFPSEFLSAHGEDAFAALAMDMFEHLPCDSGSTAISLCSDDPTEMRKAGRFLTPIAMRSHGYDIAEAMSLGGSLGSELCSGAHWLTLLSDRLIGKLGGRDALAAKLVEGIEVRAGARGLMLRAGATPEIGDTNRNQKTPLLASVAAAIEGITHFGHSGLRPYFEGDSERRDRWERRFWWQ